MNVEVGLYQQQGLKLAMTPQLKQAIALLQYPAVELAAYIEGKALENPLIELDESYLSGPGRAYGDSSWIDQISGETATLKSYLHGQIPFQVLTRKEEQVLQFLIDNVDENGYLRITFPEVQSYMLIDEAEWNVALSILQALEPAGVGARSLQECLLLQANREQGNDSLLEKVLSDYFDLLVNRRWKEIAKQMDVKVTDIQRIFDNMQEYNPKPGSSLSHGDLQYIVPDVSVSFIKGDPVVRVLSIRGINESASYTSVLNEADEQTRRYMNQKKMELNWLKKAMEQREDTLRRVAYAIVERQAAFFKNGKKTMLVPLTMREISKMVDVHESTVSRAIKDKMLETPFGIFEMKLFFSNAIPSNFVEDSSSERVKQELQCLIKSEEKTTPLSDDALAKKLQETCGIVISRRTIAKYRNQLQIPSSSKRKRYEI